MTSKLLLTSLAAATAALMAFAAAPASAVSPSEEQCEGTFTREKGTVTCTTTTTTNTGNSENSQTVTETTGDTSNGTLNNKPKHEPIDDCGGPGNSGDNSDHCN